MSVRSRRTGATPEEDGDEEEEGREGTAKGCCLLGLMRGAGDAKRGGMGGGGRVGGAPCCCWDELYLPLIEGESYGENGDGMPSKLLFGWIGRVGVVDVGEGEKGPGAKGGVFLFFMMTCFAAIGED